MSCDETLQWGKEAVQGGSFGPSDVPLVRRETPHERPLSSEKVVSSARRYCRGGCEREKNDSLESRVGNILSAMNEGEYEDGKAGKHIAGERATAEHEDGKAGKPHCGKGATAEHEDGKAGEPHHGQRVSRKAGPGYATDPPSL